MQIRPFQATCPNWEKLPEPPDDFFESVKENFVALQNSEYFSDSAQPEAIYVYRIQTSFGSHTGVVACADVQDYLAGNILGHEHTLDEKINQQRGLFLERNAIVKPVLLTYPPEPAIQAFLENYIGKTTAFCTLKTQHEKHQLWQIKDPKNLQIIQLLFQKHLPHAVIADGHHRVSTAATLFEQHSPKKYASFLTAFFASDQLKILPFYRIVKLGKEASPYLFFEELSKICDIRHTEYAISLHRPRQMTMYFAKKWYELSWKSDFLEKISSKDAYDVSLLNEHIIMPLLGVADIRSSSRIKYVEGSRKWSEIASQINQDGAQSVAFGLYPLDIRDMMQAANTRQTLPPKSTCFAPRMKNGILIQKF